MDDDDCGEDSGENKYSQNAAEDQFTLTTVNPAFGEGLRGVRILSQLVPYRLSTVEGRVSGNTVHLTTRNVWRFRIKEPKQRKVHWMQRFIRVSFYSKLICLAYGSVNKKITILRTSFLPFPFLISVIK